MRGQIRNLWTVAAVVVLSLGLLGGCFRQSIESTPPPNAAPDSRVGPTPAYRDDHTLAPTAEAAAPATAVQTAPRTTTDGTRQSLAIEETYVVDAPKDAEAKEPALEEADLGAEPAAKPAPAVGAAAVEAGTAAASAEKAPAKAATPDLMGEMYYVQVGAFGELENANKVLASLIERGYDGSKLVMTDDGRFQVQAGAFTDKAAAEAALEKLLPAYKGAYIRQGLPQ